MTTQNDSIHFTSGYSEVNGLKMYYEIHGEGKPLVLIHGAGSTIQTTFGRIIGQLAQSHKVIAVELQVHGHTSDRNTDLSFEQDADDVATLMKNLQIAKADIFGFSNGATTALQMAIRHPEVVNKVIAASTLCKREDAPAQFWEFMKQGKFEDMPQQYKDEFKKVAPDPSAVIVMHNKCVKRMVEFKDIPDGQLQSIKAPVLIINGDQDVMTSEGAVKLHRLINGSRLAIIPGGHGAYIGEITTLNSGTDKNSYVIPMISDFLDAD